MEKVERLIMATRETTTKMNDVLALKVKTKKQPEQSSGSNNDLAQSLIKNTQKRSTTPMKETRKDPKKELNLEKTYKRNLSNDHPKKPRQIN